MEKYLIHSNELHLIDAEKIHQAVEKMMNIDYLIIYFRVCLNSLQS